MLKFFLEAKPLTDSGKVEGEKSMWIDRCRGTGCLIKYHRSVYPGLYVAGMAVNAVFGAHCMDSIFKDMLLSGKKVAQELVEKIKNNK